MSVRYSVVIPVYNGAATVGEVVAQLRAFFADRGDSYEIVLVNDGSRDDSWNVIEALAHEYAEVTSIDLLKNYGQHSANMCGFRATSGDYVITMDDDLQNPPAEITKLIDAAGSTYDLVIGEFEEKRHALGRRISSRIVGNLIRRVFRAEDDLVLTNFRLIRRDVIDRVCRDNSTSPYIPGLVLRHSARRRNVVVRHEQSAGAGSRYTLRSLVRLVATILFNHSTIPLRVSAAIGFFAAFLSFVLGGFYLLHTLLSGSSTPGWPTLVMLIAFFNGILILLISVIGEYVIRMLRDLSSLPSYEVRDVVGQ